MAFLDGAPPERLCKPILEYITGGHAQLAGLLPHPCPASTLFLGSPTLASLRLNLLPCLSPHPAAAARGGEIRMKSGIKNIELNPDGTVK